MRSQIPLIAYFEGIANVNDILYNYISSVNLQISGVRVLSRDGISLEVNLLKNGTIFDIVDISNTDTGNQSIPIINFMEAIPRVGL